MLAWINRNRHGGIIITKEHEPDDLKIFCWADASDNSHWDAKGHSGIVITLGCKHPSLIRVISKKQTLVAGSSTDAEMIAVYTAVPPSLKAWEMLADWNYDNGAITMFQDNISTIIMSHQGYRPYSDKVAMNRRYFKQEEYIKKGVITMPHCDSALMLSDCLSKANITKTTAVKQLRQIAGMDDIETTSSHTAVEKEVLAYLCHTLRNREDDIDEISSLFTFIELELNTCEHVKFKGGC